MAAVLRNFIPKRTFHYAEGRSISHKVRRAATPKQLEELCQKEGDRFLDEHWKITATALSFFSNKGQRSEVLAAEKGINSAMAASMESKKFSLETISDISWTYGKLGVNNPQLLAATKEDLRKRNIEEGELNDLTKMAWSFTLFQDWDKEALIRISQAIEGKVKSGILLREDEFFRLKPVSLAGRVKWNKEILGSETALRVNTYMQERQFIIPAGSKFQEEVTAWVKLAFPGSEWETEYFLEGYHVDLACPSLRIAVEIDGPQHYYPGTKELIARDRLMDHLFKGLGWTVVRIPYWEWKEANTPEKKLNCITQKITCCIKTTEAARTLRKLSGSQ